LLVIGALPAVAVGLWCGLRPVGALPAVAVGAAAASAARYMQINIINPNVAGWNKPLRQQLVSIRN